MKTANIQHLAGVLLLVATVLTGCKKDNTLDEIKSTPRQQQQATANEFVQALTSVEGVRNIRVEVDETGADTVYFFSFRQPVNHKNPEQGTFDQQVAVSFKGFDKDVVLYTHGYEMGSKYASVKSVDLRQHLDANQVNVEHRYFGNSLPEPADRLGYYYFNAEQQALDLHAVVQALQQHVFRNGKWASTGLSKDGITSALYAYYCDLYGWSDIDVFVPFCSPFLTGSIRDGRFSCMDSRTGEYIEQVCGTGYAQGTKEAVACQRLRDIPKYICGNKRVREACNRLMLQEMTSQYRKIVDQYSQKSQMSTGNLEKDVTALAYHTYYGFLFNKFSYIPFPLWASMVPDPAKAATDDEELDHLCRFLMMDHQDVNDSLKVMAASGMQTRSEVTDMYSTLWDYLKNLRESSSEPYDVQAFMELGFSDNGYNTVDGTFLTRQQAADVCYLFSLQKRFEGIYTQDQGKLMSSFRQWVGSEQTQNIIFVYAKNDPWTGGRPDDTAVSQNPRTVMVIDPIAVHNDYFLDNHFYTEESKRTIIDTLNRFMK